MLNQEVRIQDQKNCATVFTQRESECVTQAMQGKNLLEIAKSLKISQQSVYFYLASIRNKVDVLTRQVLPRSKKRN